MNRPSRHVRRVRTKRGIKQILINPFIRKRKTYSARVLSKEELQEAKLKQAELTKQFEELDKDVTLTEPAKSYVQRKRKALLFAREFDVPASTWDFNEYTGRVK